MARWFVTSLLLSGFWGWMVGPATNLALAADDKPAAKESGAAKEKTGKSGKTDAAKNEASPRHANKRDAAKGESDGAEKTGHGRHCGHHHCPRTGKPGMQGTPEAERRGALQTVRHQ